MKQLLLLILISFCISAKPIALHTKAKPPKENPQPQSSATAEIDDDVDGQVVLANVANMLGCIGMLSTDPYNPAVAGPSLAQIGVSFINIITQILKSHGLDEEITRACMQDWFSNLANEEKMEIINAFMVYADHVRTQQYCPNCECEACTADRLSACRDCR